MNHFTGTETYIASNELQVAVNAAIHLQKPLLVKGEPGTGKTLLAHEIANSLGKKLITWHIKSTTKAQQGLYEYDAVSRLRDSQLGNEKVHDIANYIVKGKLWEAFDSDESVVLLIDEIDKADIEFPNDLLLELDKMEFAPEIPYESITPEHVLFDMIYNPAETVFLKNGRKRGATTINGLQMLERQAEESWRIWNEL